MAGKVITLGVLVNAAIDQLMADIHADGASSRDDLLGAGAAIVPGDYETLLELARDYPFLGTSGLAVQAGEISAAELIRLSIEEYIRRKLSDHLDLLERNGKYPPPATQ